MPTACLIDITRLASRIGRGPLSGIDRVELAWLRHLLSCQGDLVGLIGQRGNYLTVGRATLARFAGGFTDGIAPAFSPAHLRFLPRKYARRRAIRSMLGDGRRFSNVMGLVHELNGAFAGGGIYLNFGHQNISSDLLHALKDHVGLTSGVMIHDAIPLEHAQFQDHASPERFRTMLQNANDHGDCLIYTAEATRRSVLQYIANPGNSIVAPLAPALSATGAATTDASETFVALSTIEPRKGYDLLLDVWQSFVDAPPAQGMPTLKVIGRRGWAKPETFARLDRMTAQGHVQELNAAGDAAVAAHLQSAAALLFPSDAEGFGLPAFEAAAMNLPVICKPLPVFRELLGNIPVYVSDNDVYSWRQAIENMMDTKKRRAEQTKISAQVGRQALPTWDSHFNTVLMAVS